MSTALFSFPIFRRAPTSSRPGMKTQERKARRLLSQKAEMFESFWSFSKNNQVFSGFSCKLSPQPGTGPNLVATHRGRERDELESCASRLYGGSNKQGNRSCCPRPEIAEA